MLHKVFLSTLGVAVTLFAVASASHAMPAKGDDGTHIVVGTLKDVDTAAKKVVVTTADGVEETVKFTERTTVHGLEKGAKVIALTAKKGEQVVVHYTEKGADKTAIGIEDVGKVTAKVMEGTLVRVDKGGRYIVVKTAEGVEETMHLAERAMIDTAQGAKNAVEYTAKGGEKVTVHYTEKGGKKIAHAIEATGHAISQQ